MDRILDIAFCNDILTKVLAILVSEKSKNRLFSEMKDIDLFVIAASSVNIISFCLERGEMNFSYVYGAVELASNLCYSNLINEEINLSYNCTEQRNVLMDRYSKFMKDGTMRKSLYEEMLLCQGIELDEDFFLDKENFNKLNEVVFLFLSRHPEFYEKCDNEEIRNEIISWLVNGSEIGSLKVYRDEIKNEKVGDGKSLTDDFIRSFFNGL